MCRLFQTPKFTFEALERAVARVDREADVAVRPEGQARDPFLRDATEDVGRAGRISRPPVKVRSAGVRIIGGLRRGALRQCESQSRHRQRHTCDLAKSAREHRLHVHVHTSV